MARDHQDLRRGAEPAGSLGVAVRDRRRALGLTQEDLADLAGVELSLLLAVGADAVGDVQVVPRGVLPAEVPARLEVREVTEVRFADLLAELGIHAERTALPGVQDKVGAAVLNLPVAQRGARFILKLEPPEFAHLVENEAFFLRAARLSGLRVAPARVVHDLDGRPGLLVERFDRSPRGDGRPPGSLVVEDACQAPLPAARTLLTQLVFAYLCANGDAHAKNLRACRTAAGSGARHRPTTCRRPSRTVTRRWPCRSAGGPPVTSAAVTSSPSGRRWACRRRPRARSSRHSAPGSTPGCRCSTSCRSTPVRSASSAARPRGRLPGPA